MKTRDFYFELPPELIAQRPPLVRGASRLMFVRRATGEISHHMMDDLPALLPPAGICVFNNSRVRKARLYAADEAGREFEFLLLSTRDRIDWAFLSNKSRRLRPGKAFVFPEGLRASVQRGGAEGGPGDGGGFFLRFERPLTEDYLERSGCVPLPPYIRRRAEADDSGRYQTVYSDPVGSAAAPTAGLHFTGPLLSALDARGLERVMVTLHVGLGTFLPVRARELEEHTMHSEEYFVGEEAARKISRCKEEGRPLIAVGTTSLRVVESAWEDGRLRSGRGLTDIFIYPGYRFRAVDILFTNFHTPESTLLMLVSAFAGKALIFKAYNEAIREKYRFFSYGDAMLIL
jgi:S-adenosylmethionine:tRNA ribosyltransferase-isomerase